MKSRQQYQAIIILFVSSLSIIMIGFFITGSYIYDMIIDDGCEVDAVDVLPDVGGRHHYILYMYCDKTGNRTMDILTHDNPPTPGPLPNPVKDYGIVFIILGVMTTALGIVLGFLSIYYIVICFRRREEQKTVEPSYTMFNE